jgi:hypothetical protein
MTTRRTFGGWPEPWPRWSQRCARNHAVVSTDVRRSTGRPVSDTVETLILDLLEWLAPNPRPYAEVLEAWRTSCPRLPVWEDANDRGFIARHRVPVRGALVSVSAAGAQHLRTHRQRSPR